MADGYSFNVGVLDKTVHEYRRRAEDRLAKAFGLPDRMEMNKVRLYEFLWIEIANASDEAVKRAINILRGIA